MKDDSIETGLEIAVIGMAGKFPGAQDINEFWTNLKNGVEAISFFSDKELEESGIDARLIANPYYVKARGVLPGIDYFDSSFFNYTPAEARVMEPKLRVYHECTWTALEDAGYNPETYEGLIGVYSGAYPDLAWLSANIESIKEPSEHFDLMMLNNLAAFSTRISYNFNLKGPSFTLQTACSTSLVAIHLACQGLLNAECDMALAGGVSFEDTGKTGYMYQEGMIGSPDGHCRAFDARAKGTVSGYGAGVVLLKRLEDAVTDGDYIYAVIKGSAINNDGRKNAGYTAPDVEGEAAVIIAALEAAETEPESISYIETHGTGTILGDPVELAGLKLAFNTGEKNYCGIGAIKTNLGHLDTAAGVAGFIKTVLALKHQLIPPSLHYETPNPKTDLENSPFYVVTQLKEWKSDKHPLRAGVSSLGVGGTNAHVILEQAPAAGESINQWVSDSVGQWVNGQRTDGRGGSLCPPLKSRNHQLILLSAKSRSALDKITGNLAAHLKQNPDINLADAAYTLHAGRKVFQHRRMLVAANIRETIETLTTHKARTFLSPSPKKTIVFMFSGQGNQYVNMGWDLYRQEPIFREEMNRCFEILQDNWGIDIKHVLYPRESGHKQEPAQNRGEAVDNPVENEEKIRQFIYASPIKFSFEYSLARLLIRWGIVLDAMIGHSFGEYVAACLSGVFTLEEALNLTVWRGKLMQQLPGGAMLSVPLPEKELEPFLNDDISLAAVNAPSICVVSGPIKAVETLEKHLKEEGHDCIRLKVPRAGHSAMMTPILETFQQKVNQIRLKPPQIPYISGLTGRWITVEEALDPGYWARHLRCTIRFYDGLTELLKKPDSIFVQVGPGRGLTMFLDQHPGKKPGTLAVNMVRHYKDDLSDVYFTLDKLGQLWLYGAAPDWKVFYEGQRRCRVSLPTYPFERRRFRGSRVLPHQPQWSKKPDIGDWFYLPSWKQIPLPAKMPAEFNRAASTWLIFTDQCGLGVELTEQLKREHQNIRVVKVNAGPGFRKINRDEFTLNPHLSNYHQYEALFNELKHPDNLPNRIVHLWGVTSQDHLESFLQRNESIQDLGFHSLIRIARAIGKLDLKEELHITVVTNNMQAVSGEEELCPLKATIIGPVKLIPREYNNINCRSIDFGDFSLKTQQKKNIVSQLLTELMTDPPEKIIAYRGNCRWIPCHEPIRLETPQTGITRLKKKGIYLVTGGLGGIGLVLAEELAKNWQARLILINRSDFPIKDDWQDWLNTHDRNHPISLKIIKIKEMEKLGAKVLVLQADAANQPQMEKAIARAESQFGPINGVIHAAGVADGAVIQMRTAKLTGEVLAPKIKGTLVLDRILGGKKRKNLDFFVLCSSINSILAPIGQVAHCAANAFLDAFARYQSSINFTASFMVSINWDTWQEVGMAVGTVSHPLLDRRGTRQLNANRQIYISTFSAHRHWVLDEHRLTGKPTLPGTAYLEMVAAAFENHVGKAMVHINEIFFLTPLMLEEDEEKEVRTLLEKQTHGPDWNFSVLSCTGPGNWQVHAKGTVTFLEPEPPVKHDIKKIRETCDGKEIIIEKNSKSQSQFLTVGPRWNHFKTGSIKDNQAVVFLELPADFKADLSVYKLHPALMDTATAFLSGKFTQNYLPFCFKGIKIKGPLPAAVISYARYVRSGNGKTPAKELELHITIMDEQGRELVVIEKYIMLMYTGKQAVGPETPGPQEIQENRKWDQELREHGIRSGEGVETFKRILSGTLPQVLVSTIDFPLQMQQYEGIDRINSSGFEEHQEEYEHDNHQPAGTSISRHNISSAYIPPETKTEQILVGIWQGFLGIQTIGTNDDFFELGGDSLKALTIISKIRKKLNVDVSLTGFFNSPTIKNLAQHVDSAAKSIYDSILPIEEKEYYELSSAQKRLYFIQTMNPGNISYNLPQVSILTGNLDKQRLQQAFHLLIQRHDSLQTSFVLKGKDPVQIIHREVDFQVEYKEAEEKEIKEIAASFTRPFNLEKVPLMRSRLIRLKGHENQHIFFLDLHHIIADATALAVLQKDLFKLYNNEENSPQKLQYKDFSTWQNKLLESGKTREQEKYWLNLYPGKIPKLDFPLDYPRPEVPLFSGDSYEFRLGKAETQQFKEIAFQMGTTLYVNLLTALNVLLFKYTGQKDIIVGTTIAGRPHADLQEILGMFANTLALRNHPEEEITYLEFLKIVKTTTLEAFENQDMQFEILVEKLNLQRTSSRNPLFDVCLMVENYEQPTFEAKDLKILPYPGENRTSKFDFTLWANEIEEEIRFILEYSTELFKPSTMQDFSQHFLEVLNQVIENNNIKLKDIRVSHRLQYPQTSTLRVDFDF